MKQYRSQLRLSGNLISTKAGNVKTAAKSSRAVASRPAREGKVAGSRKNTKILAGYISQGPSYCQAYFETIGAEELIRIFEESYCSSLVNFLLDLKRSTAKRIFEILVRLKKKAFLNVIALYYYKEYMTNPFPLTLDSETGRDCPNHYAILGIPREISGEDLRTAHKMLLSSFNAEGFPPPDRKLGEERLREINVAFEILKNPKRRKELDTSLPNISYLYPRRDQSWLDAVTRLGI